MVIVYIDKNLLSFEADIRDLVMAFYPLQKLIFVYENDSGKYLDNKSNEVEIIKKSFLDENNFNKKYNIIEIKNYYKNILNDKNRKETKLDLKRKLYDYLSIKTKKKLSWGTLTGIRPVTIVTDIIENKFNNKNVDYNKIKNELKKYYYLSKNKIDELINIAKNEINILNKDIIKNYKNEYSIYIGVPFCKSTCLYCSFTSFNIDKYDNYVSKYLDKLEQELKKNNNKNPMTLYIGGGTPTSLNENEFDRLLCIIDENISKKNLIEYTIEAGRPDTITKEKLISMKNHGVTRISINPQTFNQKTLDLIGRKHTIQDIIEKYYMARELGFENINMDIIIGLPNERLKDIKNTLRFIRKLKPDSLTVHSLALKRSARLNKELPDWIKNNYFAGLVENSIFDRLFGNILYYYREIDKMFMLCNNCAKDIGLNAYYLYRQKNMAGNLENVGYAKNNKECIYNIMMMSERHSVYGFGTATTKIITYKNKEKIIQSIEGYKSIIDYCK